MSIEREAVKMRMCYVILGLDPKGEVCRKCPVIAKGFAAGKHPTDYQCWFYAVSKCARSKGKIGACFDCPVYKENGGEQDGFTRKRKE